METRRRMMMAAAGAVPQEFEWHETFAGVSAVFTASAGAMYRFHVIARGGDGAAGGNSWCGTEDNGTDIDVECELGQGGGAGASGAYALHEVYMRNGETAQITYSDDKTVLVVGGDTITVLSGGDGSAGVDVYGESETENGGIGREATGANRLNLQGRNGESGDGKNEEIFSESFSVSSSGGDARIPEGASYMGTYYATQSGAQIRLGGGGYGGDSEGFVGTEQINGWIRVSYVDAKAGSTGSIGGVVVEREV